MAKPAGETTPRKRKRSNRAATGQQVVVGRAAEAFAGELLADVETHYDGLSAPLQAAVAMAAEAKSHLAGAPSERIARLAEAQSSTPEALAHAIIERRNRFWALQEERAAVQRDIRDLGARSERRQCFAGIMKANGIDARRGGHGQPPSPSFPPAPSSPPYPQVPPGVRAAGAITHGPIRLSTSSMPRARSR
ncbi:hypothetical protein [Enterovirga sp. CN4-39]|uniref:hypothetical protein n=1 Tax=Enterovirga sp. CN4-39 TaxID=3400910 RepID=UPI003C0A6685